MPFDYNEYQQKCNTLSTEQLHREWENYTRQIAGGATSTATSVLFSPVTGGISLIGLGLSAPRIHNARKKREIIEAGLQARGATHNTRKRDVVAPMAIAGTISGLTLGLAGPGADIIAGEAVGKGAEYAISHAALDGAGALLEHKHDDHLKIKAEQKMRMQQQQQGLQAQHVQGPVQGVQIQPQMIPYQVQTPLPGTQILHPVPQVIQSSSSNVQYQQPSNLVPDQKYVYATMPPSQQTTVAYQPASHQQSLAQPPPVPLIVPQPVPAYQANQPTRSRPEDAPAIPSATKSTEGYPPEKTPAYTTQAFPPEEDVEFQHPAGCPTPLPLNAQVDKSQVTSPTDAKISQELLSQVAETEPVTVALTMEEEIMFLKAKLLQMELEKREGVKPSIPETPPATQEAQSSPEKKETPPVAQYSNQTQGPPTTGHQRHPSLSITTAPTTQPPQQYYAPPPASPAPPTITPMMPPQQHQAPPSPNPQFYPPPPPRSPHPQTNAPPPMQQQQTYPPLPTTPQPQPQAYHPPQPQQQQRYPPQSHTPQPQQQAYIPPQQQQTYPQPPKSPQPQFQRNDSGYASMASTPMPQYNPQQTYNPAQQQYNPQNHIVSPQSTGNTMLSPQITGPSQQYGHGRTGSYSQPSPMSPAPPPYFPPPPGQQVGGGGKDYFGQAGPQQIYQPQQGTQGWQWGAPAPAGQPNYGPPPSVPQPYR